ncbi:UNVERIFIED_CONTAM: hypothetical protein FKN15_017279 [Acipenser sinensis]
MISNSAQLYLAEGLVEGLEVHQPARLSATLGETVTLHCNFTCTLQDGDRLFGKFYRVEGGKNIYTENNIVSQTTCTVSSTIANITLESEAVYYCEVKIPRRTTPIDVNGSGTAVTVHAEPSSMKIPEPQTLVLDTEALLSCVVNGFYPQSISVTWFHRDLQVPLTSITNHLTTNRNGTFSLTSQYRFTPAVRDNGTVCRCQASHQAWRRHMTLERVLDVKYGPQSLNLTSQNSPVPGAGSNKTLELPDGSPLHVSCWSDGNPRPWTGWFKDRGDGLTPAEPPVGCSNETLHVGAVQREDEGVYWCVARNSYGERNTSFTLLVVVSDYVTSFIARLLATVIFFFLVALMLICTTIIRDNRRRTGLNQGEPEPFSMEIPEPQTLVVDTEALLSCAVNGFYPQSISVTWFHRDLQVPLTSITNHLTTNRNGTFSLTSQYRFTPAVRDNGTVCRCQASHQAWRHHVTQERVMDVKYGPQSLNLTSQNRPVLGAGSNKTLELPAGSPLHVSCWPDGNPRPWTGWFKDSGDGLTPVEPPVGCSNETLHVGAVQREDEGVYWCVARNSYGERNTSFTLLVVVHDYAEGLVEGLEVHQPAQLSAALGETVTLHCNFTCTLQDRDRLYGKFYRVEGGKNIYTENNTVSRTICTVSSTIANITLESEAVYYCELKIPSDTTPINVNGSGTAVTVYAEPSSMEIPEPQTLVVDTEALLICAVNRFYPQSISVTWFHRDLQVPLTSITNYLTTNRNGTFSLTSQYRFTPAVRDNGTVCRCQASHPAWRRHVTLERVLDVKYGPQSLNLTYQNRTVLGAGSNKTLELPAGSPLHVSCFPDGNPRPWTGWFKDSGDGLTAAEPPVGCSNETLHVGAVQREDEGVYWCVARNSYGERNTSFTLLVVVYDYVSLVSSVTVATCVLLLGVVLICLYARRKPREKLCTAEEPQLTYADIRFKPPPRHKKKRASENTEILYSETAGVCHPCEESRLEEPVCTVYALAQLP